MDGNGNLPVNWKEMSTDLGWAKNLLKHSQLRKTTKLKQPIKSANEINFVRNLSFLILSLEAISQWQSSPKSFIFCNDVRNFKNVYVCVFVSLCFQTMIFFNGTVNNCLGGPFANNVYFIVIIKKHLALLLIFLIRMLLFLQSTACFYIKLHKLNYFQ